MILNKHWMYTDGGLCRMCPGSEKNHHEGCPATIIEGLKYEMAYYGPHCDRGCCGESEGSVMGDTLEECATKAADYMRDAVSHSCNSRLVYNLYFEDEDAIVEKAMEKIRQEEKAKQEEEEMIRKAAVKADALNRLENMRSDLTPEAYQRRLSEINAC